MDKVVSYRDLLAWQRAMQVAQEVYKVARKLPREETYAMSDQMRRAAVSIPSNIAEGKSRGSLREYINFLKIARGSKAELETQLMLCVSINMLTEEDIAVPLQLLAETGRLINALIRSLQDCQGNTDA